MMKKLIVLLILLLSLNQCQNIDDTINDDESNESVTFVAWATGYTSVHYGQDVDTQWQVASNALGQAEGTSTDIVCLGNGGDITMTFDASISNGIGADFAVFENSFSETFLELAYVEVSSDGSNFVRFDNESLTASPVSAFGSIDPNDIMGLAGKYKQGIGTPFDLNDLANKALVVNGTVDIDHITHVRIVDIVGCDDTTTPDCSEYTFAMGYPFTDTQGNHIYDPHLTTGSGGFDLDAIGVFHQNE